MGRPSNKRRSARRPGKRERIRVKKRRRTVAYRASSAGACTFKAGRKKWREAYRSRNPDNPWSLFHLMGNHISKAGT